jgi:streptogramin lyase
MEFGAFVELEPGSGGLNQPRGLAFGHDGNLYVTSQGTGQILRYDGQTGAFLNTFVTVASTPGPFWLKFGTDGYLYTTARTTSSGSDTNIMLPISPASPPMAPNR